MIHDINKIEAEINKALHDIAEAIEEAHGTAVESLHFAYIIPTQTNQLTDALSEAIAALKTAYTLAEALQNQPHEFQR